MATQFSEPPVETAFHSTSSSPPHGSLRRSLHIPQGATSLISRRFSRTSGVRQSSEPVDIFAVDDHQQPPQQIPQLPTLHVRIVPSIENPNRCMIFDIVDRVLEAGTIIKLGRFAERAMAENHLSFKSKVVSRSHCEIRMEHDGKLYVRDTRSSSGTFLNHVRLSPANQESKNTEIKDGDIVQLGVDYQGGLDEIYRSVKMRFEVNHTQNQTNSYSVSAFTNLRNFTSPPRHMCSSNPGHGTSNLSAGVAACAAACVASTGGSGCTDTAASGSAVSCTQQQVMATTMSADDFYPEESVEVEECCICLYAIAPFQALFVAPCAHSYHYKCIRPLLKSYPGFQCPICRTYSDLEASVAIEAEEVIEKYHTRSPMAISPPLQSSIPLPQAQSLLLSTNPGPVSPSPVIAQPLETVSAANSTDRSLDRPHGQPIEQSDEELELPPFEDTVELTPQETIAVAHPIAVTESALLDPLSTFVPSPALSRTQSARDTDAVDFEGAIRPPLPLPTGTTGTEVVREEDEEYEEASQGNSARRATEALSPSLSPSSSPPASSSIPDRRTTNLMEKIRMAFSEKRKPTVSGRSEGRNSRARSATGYSNVNEDEEMMDGGLSDDPYSPTSSSPSPPSSPGGFQRSLSVITHTLSRQSTTHNNTLANIEEEERPEDRNNRQWNSSDPSAWMYCA
ncbi:hypothetical protein PHYBLDRAFT_80024 [Phycomyces blakesleeanus NRRL 1555(-)]|uniref:FHA domain-containing protein n=1 Tax=Phycomyces blakesleeanus (strain ATCC 8743b / DSM 1359 / FGSC 10004 / NBRC 33097 / NRRL 1555) TaxID=763407 RepID=A0A162N8V3_PHYB8|nr:hypothetical protein PHYBLDRAFT_80024 [Phycomyces blakesleeanus NRRL 1555(-)]OAD72188.1 hypothetical protein PHYBLDRAFT_80024 [Phycomyces blakesleeanus NRRL 1555(-)]|eukprot:XP_018290228.1 hypothetical protein PHYBLDRAFT_80024 [Phycomyces blakesleeanus NRRL 1555(-)]